MPDTRAFTDPQPVCLLRLVSEELDEHQPVRAGTPERWCRSCGDPWPCTARAVAQSVDPANSPAPQPMPQEDPRKNVPAEPEPELEPAAEVRPAFDSWWSGGTAVGVASVPPPINISWQHGVSSDGAADLYTATPTRGNRP